LCFCAVFSFHIPKHQYGWESLFSTKGSVADLHRIDADPVRSFHFDADLDPTFHLNDDPDPTFHQSDANLQPLVYGSILSFFLNLRSS
jgi:hypothetical protein